MEHELYLKYQYNHDLH